ncbi:hypothetical protein NUW54_g1802 [Trametes sanguinea]|uniref:Uncharacterized protein n=1 Tax=Trametes sanguinea TaxID=158606 RepID=A0ACC1Q880_9APHY|nr:hypothetical protein NUW54_g1802 [Trametes sanguinea]
MVLHEDGTRTRSLTAPVSDLSIYEVWGHNTIARRRVRIRIRSEERAAMLTQLDVLVHAVEAEPFLAEVLLGFFNRHTEMQKQTAGRVDAPHKSPPADFAFCAQDSAISAPTPWLARRRLPTYATPQARAKALGCARDARDDIEGCRRSAKTPTTSSSCFRLSGNAGSQRRARKRSRALRAVAAWFRIVSVTIQIPVPRSSASQSASVSASALRPAFPSALRIAFHCVCDYCEALADTVANSANSANQACAPIASCEAREDREAS